MQMTITKQQNNLKKKKERNGKAKAHAVNVQASIPSRRPRSGSQLRLWRTKKLRCQDGWNCHAEQGVKMTRQVYGDHCEHRQGVEKTPLTLLSSLCIAWMRASSSCAEQKDSSRERGKGPSARAGAQSSVGPALPTPGSGCRTLLFKLNSCCKGNKENLMITLILRI